MRKAFGRRLRFLRLLENKTQAGLAESVGVTEEHLGNIERGVSVPSFDLICRLAKELCTQANNLFLFDGLDLTEAGESALDLDGMDWKQYVTRIGFWQSQAGGDGLTLSNSLFDILGHEPSPEKQKREWLRGMIHPDDLHSVQDGFRRAMEGERPFNHTFRFFRKDGTVRLGLIQGETSLDREGKVEGMNGVFLDISEQKRFEAALLSTRRKMEELVAGRTRDMREALDRAERETEVRARAEEDLAQELELRLSAEFERERSEAQLELILSSMADGVAYFSNPDMRVTWCNQVVADMTNMTPRQVVGRYCYKDRQGRDAPCPDCPVRAAFDSRRTQKVVHYTPDGRAWSVQAFPVFDADGEIMGVAEVVRDISDTKKAEEIHRRFEAIVNASKEPLALMDRDGVCLAANDAHAEYYGLTGAEMVGRSLAEIFGQKLFDETIRERFQRAVTGEIVEFEVWRDTPSGGRICMAVRYYPYRDEEGEVAGVAVMATNITDRKLYQERLRVQSQILASSPDPMFFADRDLVYRIVNDQYLQLRSLTREQAIGKPVGEIVEAEDYEANVRPRLERAMQGETVRLLEWVVFPGPKPRCMDITYVPCRDDLGGVTGVVATLRDVTTRVRAQEALAESEQRCKGLSELMRRMADNMPDLLWAKDMNNRFLFANKAICGKLLHCMDTDEPLGRNDLFFAMRERKAGHRHTFGEVCVNSDDVVKESGRPGRFLEDGLVRGRYLALDVHKAPFFDDDGNMIGTVGAGRDVTEDQAIRRALEESEERFRLLAEYSPDMVWLTDSRFRLTYVSPACERLLGYSPAEMLRLRAGRMFPRDSLNEVNRVRREFSNRNLARVRSGMVTRLDLDQYAKDGRVVRMEVTAAPVYDRDDNFVGVVGINRDVSEQRRVEAEVRQSLEKFRILFELEFDAIFLVENDTTRILEANRAAERLLGYSHAELMKLRMADLSTEPELTIQSCRSEVAGVERTYRKNSGEVIPVEITSSHFTWEGRRVHISVLRDISDRKRLEQERRDVEHMLRHELRTPAQAAVTAVNMLKDEGSFTGEALELLNELERQGRSMLEAMDLHTDLHRLETGQFRLRGREVNLDEVCEDVVRDLSYLAEARRVAIRSNHKGSATHLVRGDARLLRSALLNLVKNALEACRSGQEVDIRCDEQDGYWQVVVRNPGVIPGEFREHMFKKYATHGKVAGQGLGCYLARLVAEAHGGGVRVLSPDKSSTELLLYLPRFRSEQT